MVTPADTPNFSALLVLIIILLVVSSFTSTKILISGMIKITNYFFKKNLSNLSECFKKLTLFKF